MDPGTPESRQGRWRLLLRRADQITVTVLVTACFAAITLHWIWHLAIGTSLIEIDQAPPLQLNFQVQLNQADWPELMLLPRIGEVRAKRIVEYRRQHGRFRSVEQLQEIDGIGPKTVRRIKPFVRLD
jgi:competence protein ComEA